VAAVLVGVIAAARITGHWEAGVSAADYQRIVPHHESITHP
jgi:hypothetical protein